MKLTIWHKQIQALLLSNDKEQMRLAIILIDDKYTPLYWHWLTRPDVRELGLPQFESTIEHPGFFLSKEAREITGVPMDSMGYEQRVNQMEELYEDYKIDNLDHMDPKLAHLRGHDECAAWDVLIGGQDDCYSLV